MSSSSSIPTPSQGVKQEGGETESLVTIPKSIYKPIEKEAIRLNTTFKRLSLSLLCIVLVLTLVWLVESSVEKRDFERQELHTLKNVNVFSIDKFGKVHKKLATKTDSTMYEFLADHHDTQMLQGSKKNIVTEVMLIIEHESVQVGMPLVVQLFSDVYHAWPKTTLSGEAKKTLEKLITELTQLADMPTPDSDTNAQPKEAETDGATEAKPNEDEDMVQTKLKDVRKQLKQLKDLGKVKNIDEKRYKELFETQSPQDLAALLKTIIYVDDARPYLEKIDQIRMQDMKGKPMEDIDLQEGKKQKKKASADDQTPAPTSAYIPSEENLLHASKAMEALEVFVENKVSFLFHFITR
jgi:hypothetical protein